MIRRRAQCRKIGLQPEFSPIDLTATKGRILNISFEILKLDILYRRQTYLQKIGTAESVMCDVIKIRLKRMRGEVEK